MSRICCSGLIFTFQGPSTSGSVASIPVKKNRTETLISAQSSRGTSPARKGESNEGLTTTSSDETVKEVRQKVEDLSHDESSDKLDNDSISEKSGHQSVIMEEEVNQASEDARRKRKQEDRTPSSQFLKEDTKRVRDTEGEDEEVRSMRSATSLTNPPTMTDISSQPPVSAVPSVDMDRPGQLNEQQSKESVAAPAKKTQATFGSFASTSSPFARMAPSESATEVEGADTKGLPDDVTEKIKEANALPTSAVSSETIPAKPTVKKPQASFGSFASSASPFSAVKHTSSFISQPVASSSNATAHSASPFKAASGSAFGNWSASASPFATPSRKATPKVAGDGENVEAESGNKEAVAAELKQDKKNFGDILASTSGEASTERQKVDVQQQDGKLPTRFGD